jgi:hypothetical protein
MIKAWVFGSLGAGIALLATALYVQTQPLAFTHDGIGDDALHDTAAHAATATQGTPSAAPADARERRDNDGVRASTVMELPPVVVKADAPLPATRAKAVRELEPCSEWREIGPARVVDGVALDVRRVRDLC